MDRSIAPEFHDIEEIIVKQVHEEKLDNGISFYTLDAGSQEITKIEFIFKAGMYYQSMPLIASSANKLIESGTATYTADELSDKIDFYGAFLECSVGQDYAYITLYTLNKYLNQTLPLIEEIVKHAIYPENEFNVYINNKKQKHLINSQKVSIIARRRFSELMYGESHPYGIDVKDIHFSVVNTEALRQFFSNYYHAAACTIVASGKLDRDLFNVVNKHFGSDSWEKRSTSSKQWETPQPTIQQKHFIEKGDAIQSAIRIGRPMFNKTHKDYFGFQLLNTVLGGYFGSRLMANIREDKGFTYGIGSGLSANTHGGYFYISTEVGCEVTEPTLSEIYKEIQLLREELMDESELETVKNYVLGQFLRSIDGPFALSDKFKAIWEYGLGYDYFDRYFNEVKNSSTKMIKEMAGKYLQEKDLVELVVGKFK